MTKDNTKLNQFHYGESLSFTVAAKERDGTVIDNAVSQVLKLRVSATRGGSPLLTFDSAPEVTMFDLPNGIWYFQIPYASYSADLSEDVLYHYLVTSKYSTEDEIVQAHGILFFEPSSI